MLSKSIRWTIQVWHGFLLGCLVGALTFGFYQYEQNVRLREVDNQLHDTLTPLLPRVAPPGGQERPGERGPREFSGEGGRRQRPRPEFDAPNEGEFRGPENRRPNDAQRRDELPIEMEDGSLYYAVWTRDSQLRKQSDSAPQNIPAPELNLQGSQLRTRGSFRELIHRIPNGDAVLVGASLATVQKDLHGLAIQLSLAGFIVVAIGVLGGWWLAGRALRPIAEISAAAEKIAGGDLSERINVAETESELGELAAVLNKTFERLEKNFDQQVRFTADASHELRTPISVLLTQIQLSLSRERTGEEYRQTLETCERAAERMRVLVNHLLELARADAGEETLIREPCDLGRVAREALEFVQPLAEKKKVTLKQSIEPVKTKADVMKLGQVLINLLNNAIHHNAEGIEVSLSLQKNGTRAILKIADNGAGIPEEALPHLFDRFYRVDKARARGKGNSGLGLAISKAIVESHGGTIRVESKIGQGAEFIIELPLAEKAKNEKWLSSPI